MLRNIADQYLRAGDEDLSDLQGLCEDFQWYVLTLLMCLSASSDIKVRCLQEIIHDLHEIQKTNTDKIKIMPYLMITDVCDSKISTSIQRANNLQRDLDVCCSLIQTQVFLQWICVLQTGIVTETRAILSSICHDTKSGFGSIKSSLDHLHLATEDGYAGLEQRLYVALQNDLGPLIFSNHGDLLTEIEDSRRIYKGMVRMPRISHCLDISLSGI